MAGASKAKPVSAPVNGARILIVEARFYEDLADALLEGAVAAIERAGAVADIVTVPGALEIPAAIAIAMEAGGHDAAVALGCVIRGETTHYDIVAGESCRALMDLAVERRWAIGNGILTVENEAQAWARARKAEMDKGGGAAEAALSVLRLKRRFEAAR
jgi:6,7-dimethyl-8-ribityllumazine synthase